MLIPKLEKIAERMRLPAAGSDNWNLATDTAWVAGI